MTPSKAERIGLPLENPDGFTSIALVDEDGLYKKLPVNPRATVILSGLLQLIVGDVMLLDGFDLD